MDFLFIYLVIIFSAIIHEYSHGWVANSLGDPTAKEAGRLTLNPLIHIDLWGTVLLPLFFMTLFGMFIGYAKPVPINPYNFKSGRRDVALVGLAGPASNLLMAVILGLLIRFFGWPLLGFFLSQIVLINIWLAFFNLLPIAPLDGSKVFTAILPAKWQIAWESTNPLVGIVLAVLLASWILPVISPWLANLIIGTPVF